MNTVEIIAENKYPIKSFDTKISNCSVSIKYSERKIEATLKGRKSVEKIVSLSLDIFTMFFLYQGFYPTIKSIKCNGIKYDKDLSGRFFTSDYFKKISHSVIEINEKTICDCVYKKFKDLEIHYLKKNSTAYLCSFEFICSKDYERIAENHKIMLLLHCIEGYIINSKYDQLKNTVSSKVTGKFGKSIFLVLKVLFYYDKKFKAELLKLLKVSKYKMVKILADTRNENSHYISKDYTLKDGGNMIYYFYILYYVFRVFLVKELGLDIDEDKVKNYLYEIHDWLSDNLYNGKYAYKSAIYQAYEQLKNIKNVQNP